MKLLKSCGFMGRTEFLVNGANELAIRIHNAQYSAQFESSCITLMDWHTSYTREFGTSHEDIVEVFQEMGYCVKFSANISTTDILSDSNEDEIALKMDAPTIVFLSDCGCLTISYVAGLLHLYPNTDGIPLNSEAEAVVNPSYLTENMQMMLMVALDSWLTK